MSHNLPLPDEGRVLRQLQAEEHHGTSRLWRNSDPAGRPQRVLPQQHDHREQGLREQGADLLGQHQSGL